MQLATIFDYNVKFYFQFQLNEIIPKLSMKNETVQHGILLCSMKDWISEGATGRKGSIKIAVLKNFTIFTGKHLCRSLFFIKLQAGLQLYYKETPTQVFSCEYFEIFKNTYFGKHLRTAAFNSFREKLPSKMFNSFMTDRANLQRKSVDWFLYDNGPRHERVNTHASVQKIIWWFFRRWWSTMW